MNTIFREPRTVFMLLAALVVGSLSANIAVAQRTRISSKRIGNLKPKPVVTVRPLPPNVEPSRTAFVQAAVENESLQYSLRWTFSKRTQRGWYLYVPLIQHLLVTDAPPDSVEFASALADWQLGNDIEPNGILDDVTMTKLVHYWQSIRIDDKTPPTAEQLITAPANDFVNGGRNDELRQIDKNAYAALKRMIAAAAADKSLGLNATADGGLSSEEKLFKIMSSFRTHAEQSRLRRRSRRAGRAAVAVNSPHFTGRAFDIYIGVDSLTTSNANRALQIQSKVYLWLVANADRFGFDPYFYEPWHWEYTGKIRSVDRQPTSLLK